MTGLRHFSRRQLLRCLRRRQLLVELLEDRRLLSVFTVDSPGDEPDWLPGDGKALTISKTTTLRAAIMEANASVGKDTIEFNIPSAGPHVIKLATRLPAMIDPISIDGYSQPGASPTSMTLQYGNNAVIQVELDGSLLPLGTNGLELFGGDSEVKGLAIHSFYGSPIPVEEFLGLKIVAENGAAIWLWGGGGNQVVGNFLGATATGVLPANHGQSWAKSSGVLVGSAYNMIRENLIVGNEGSGVVLGSKYGDVLAKDVHDNKIYGNYIGMQQNGQTPMPNSTGVLVCWGAGGNEIGGDSANLGNLISGNSGTGISIVGVGPEGKFVGANIIQRNLIGTDRTGTLIDPDKKPKTGDETGNRHVGIQIDRSPNNVIGGAAADAGNLVSGNLGGVLIVGLQSRDNVLTSNKIGTDLTGNAALPNRLNGVEIQGAPSNQITQNLISGNAASGVRVAGATAKQNTVTSNKIGTNLAGTAALANFFSGVDISDAPQNSVVSNTISGNLGSGVWIQGKDSLENTVSRNYIGTDATGLQALGNNLDGITITDASKTTLDRNTIAASTLAGISIQGSTATLNRLYGNFIGTDVSGTKDLGSGLHGIWIQDAPANEIGHTDWGLRNVISGNTGDGIRISGKTAKGNQVFGNYVGTSIAGTAPLPNSGAGVYVENAPENIIGGETSNRRNVISGNEGCGVVIFGADAQQNKIQGNYIGTDRDGTGPGLKNGADGIFIHRAAATLVGGSATKLGEAPGNLISGNTQAGVHIKGFGARDNKVQGNVIGQDKAGVALGNTTHGVFIELASKNVIGEPSTTSAPAASTGKSNVISANNGDGVHLAGESAVGNLIRRNEIYDNTGLGINLSGGRENVRPNKDHVTPNDGDDENTAAIDPDSDDGPNELMNFPVGVTAWFDGVDTILSGVLDTTAPEDAVIDLYANVTRDSSGFGEGRYYLGSVTPDKVGVFRLQIRGQLVPPAIPGIPADAIFLSATATNSGFSTSEFSPVYGDPDGDKFVDSDDDGLPDEWETKGIDFDGDGQPDLDLRKLGANPGIKDVFVEVDVEQGQNAPWASIDDVKTSFRNAPVSNLPRGPGIVLHVDAAGLADTIPTQPNPIPFKRTPAANDDFWDLKKEFFGSNDDRESENSRNILGARNLVYHYCIVAHASNPDENGKAVVGWGNVFGNDFIIVPQHNQYYIASTFMHELGHNLGLGHGGPRSRDPQEQLQSQINYKPNHLSIMNYLYDPYLVGNPPLDYSVYREDQLVALWEGALDERLGIAGGRVVPGLVRWPNVGYTYSDGGKAKVATARSAGPVDWNHNGLGGTIRIDAQPVAANIHDAPGAASTPPSALLQSREEWNHLRYNFRANTFDRVLLKPDSTFFIEIARTLDIDDDGINNAEDNVRFVFNPDQLDSDGDGIGDVGELVSLVLSDISVPDGAQVTGTVTLLLPAPAQGALVELFSGEPWMVDLPRYIVIPAGARTASFAIPVTALNLEPTQVAVYASYGEAVVETELIIGPARTTADLLLAMTAATDPVGLGGIVAYTIDVTNHGPEIVTGVTLTDLLPDGAVLKSATGTVNDQVPGPGLRVRFDYTYDTGNFFDTQEKKDLLQLAGDILISAMGDDLAAIVPDGRNIWTAIFDNPATGAEERITDLIVPENEIIVYVGARDLGDSGTGVQEGALAGPGGLSVSGSADFNRMVTTRGERGAEGSQPTDFGPWGGTITFNTNPAVTFSYDGDVEASELDFFTAALHEMAHVLGLGTSASWRTYVDAARGLFTGPASRLEHDAGGDVPLDVDTLAHWREGLTEAGQPVLMDPLAPDAMRISYPTALDWAGLADVGWNIDGLLTVERPVKFTEMAGSVIADIGVLAPGQSVEITLEVQPTLAGTIHNVATVTGYGDDPDLSNNTAETSGTVSPLVLIVNTTDDVDDGVVDATHTSLREALNAANNALGVNTISFHIPGPSPHRIQPTSPLPVITDPIIIDGSTEPDYAGTPVIELSGAEAGFGSGLVITAGGSTVRSLVINRFQSDGSLETGNAVLLKQGQGNTIVGCYLGTNVSGTLALSNEGAGVLVLESDDNTIGGSAAGAGNLISGNADWGVFLGPEVRGNVIAGNLIGTDVHGDAALGNGQAGIELQRASSNTIGGRTPEARNVISGNKTGITIKNFTGLGLTANRVEGNYVGTNATGDAAVGNGTGIQVDDFLSTFTGRDAIGGTAPGAGNVISGNLGTGIQVIGTASIHVPDETYPIRGNLIGVAADGVTPLGNGGDGIQLGGSAAVGGFEPGAANTIAYNGGDGVSLRLERDVWTFLTGQTETAYLRGNVIHSNAGLGIDVGSDGVNAPLPGTDRGLNFYPNYPVLTRVFSGNGTTTVEGTVSAINLPLQGWRFDNVMDFYASPTADPSGYGEGLMYLGSHSVFTYDTASFSVTLPVEVPAGHVITATNSRWNMISEFSAVLVVQPDADGDGVLDAVEDAGPNGGDANHDGAPDRLQNEIASLPNAVDGQYVVLVVQPGGTLRDVRAWDKPSSDDGPPGVVFPLGFFTFHAASGLVTLRPPAGQTLDTVYNYGFTPDRMFDHWYQFLYDGFGGAEIFPDRAVLHVAHLEAGTFLGPAVIQPGTGITIVVNSVDDNDDGLPDNGHTTLREAINRANFLPGKDTITFAIPGPGPHTIRPTSSPNPIHPGLTRVSLPWITDPIIIDGYTQPGAAPAIDDTPATLMIELDGSLADGGADGLALRGGNSLVRGLVINRFGTDDNGGRGGSQIAIHTDYSNPLPGNNIIVGNYIGTDVTGSSTHRLKQGFWSQQKYGISIGHSSQNTLGGTMPAERNVIAGMSSIGVSIWSTWYDTDQATGNQVLGNFIGVDASGSRALGSVWGIRVHGAAHTIIGGAVPGAGNVISGNAGGVDSEMWDYLSPGTVIQGNRIGTDVTGTSALGNGSGITIGGWNSIVGGDNSVAANVISANAGDGIRIWGFGDAPQPHPAGRNVIQGNWIGTDVSGTLDLGNAGHGISIEASKENLVGGSVPDAGNIIAFNAGTGIVVAGAPYSYSAAYGNSILMNSVFANGGLGIDLVRSDIFSLEPDGVTPNDPADGFFVQPRLVDAHVDFDGYTSWVHVTVAGAPNWLVGVTIYFIGTSDPYYYTQVFTDENGIGELVQGFSGTGAPVQLDHVDVYDLGWFAMANLLQNYPVITSVTLSGDTTIEGTLDSSPDTTFRLEFFDNDPADASGYGEGQEFLGTIDVTTDSAGIAQFTLTLPDLIPLDHFITATATDPDGNTSEFSLAVAPTAEAWDFGDAADPTFPTLLASNGAQHALGSQVYLGSRVDAEEDGQPDGLAAGDDATSSDDEDGVVFVSPLVPGQWAALEVTASAQGRLDAWIDFSDNGTWSETEDHVFDGVTLLSGLNTLFFEVPASATLSANAFARFRLSSAGGLSFDGPAVDGEVEDYVVAIEVPPTGNRPPTAVDDVATTAVGMPVAIDVTANDMDPEGRLRRGTVTVTAVPVSGSLFVDPASGVITYLPSSGFTGDDEFSYRVADAEGLVDTAHVVVHVLPGNQPPVAVNDAATTAEDVAVVSDVLANDHDPDDNLDPTTVKIIAPPSHGLLQVDVQSGALTYMPEADFFGEDRFVYTVSDTQGAAARAVVTITVQPVSDPPLAHDDLAQKDQDVAVVVDVLANDTDADGDLDPTSVSIVAAPQHGSAEIDPVSGQITYTPATGFIGIETLLYRVFDATDKSATATVRIDVLPTSDPPQAVADAAETLEDTPVSIHVAANDTDVDGDLDPSSVRILVGPLQGTAEVDSATGRIQYTPAADFAGDELLWYEIRDARGQADIGLVHITVTPINDPPVARDDTANVLRDTPTDLYVLSNDTDVDSAIDRTTLRIEVGPTSGTVAIQADGSVRYIPRNGYTGTDQFSYTVLDDAGERSNVAVVTITVQAEPTMLVVGRTFEDLDEGGPGVAGPGVAGYPIYLLDGQGQLLATTPTQADDPVTSEDETGWYHFPDLSPGTYVVAQKRVSGWWQSYPEDQGIRLTEPPVNSGLYVVTLSTSNDLAVLDFGNYRTGEVGYASIAGHVYVDVDNDGICDPQEMGLPNVPITIEGPVTRTVLTDATGHYRADDLPAGVYTIAETQPLLFQDGRDTLGTPRLGTLENDQFVGVELLPDMVAEDYNFGEYGLKTQFIGKQLLLASTPPASVYVANLQVGRGETLLLLQAPKSGTLRAAANSEGEPSAIQVYDDHWRPVALTMHNGVLQVPVAAGEEYLVYVNAAGPAVVHAVLDAVPAPVPVYVYHNTPWASDVNGDGYLSPLDALLVINALNTSGARQLVGVNLSSTYWDVSGDMYLSPLDALLVINGLNGLTGVGEGESSVHPQLRDRALLEYLDDAGAQSTPGLEDVFDLLCQDPS